MSDKGNAHYVEMDNAPNGEIESLRAKLAELTHNYNEVVKVAEANQKHYASLVIDERESLRNKELVQKVKELEDEIMALIIDAEAKLASAEPGHVWMWATKTGLLLFATKELAEMMNKGRGGSTYIQPVAVPVIGMVATPQPAPASAEPVRPDLYQNPTTEEWFDHPQDMSLLEEMYDNLKVGFEYEINVCWTGKQTFRVTSVNGYEVEADLIRSTRTPFAEAQPAPDVQAAVAAALEKAEEIVEGWAVSAENFGFDGDAENYRSIKDEIRAIPRDTTALEERISQSVAAVLENAAHIVKTYQVSIGNSPAGEIACQMTMDNIK